MALSDRINLKARTDKNTPALISGKLVPDLIDKQFLER